MRHVLRFSAFIVLLATLSACSVGPRLMVAPLQRVPAGVGTLATGGKGLTLAVHDERPKGDVLGGGILGPQGESEVGIYLGYVPERPNEVQQLFEAAATEAAQILGFSPGGGATLELAIPAFRIDMYRFSGYHAMNCIGYGHLRTTLRREGGEPKTREFKVTYFEYTTPVSSMKEVTREAVSRIYMLAASEAVAATLLEEFGPQPDPAAVRKLLDTIATTKDEIARRRMIFWVGLLGRGDPVVKERLLAWFRTAQEQRVRQAAVEAIGRLGIAEAREDIEGMLSGAKKLGTWNPQDTEQAWWLVKALCDLGVKDVESMIPKSIKMRSKLLALVQFRKTGEIPPLSNRERELLEQAKAGLKRG